MDEKNKEAVNYAASSNKLEEQNVTPKEFQEILSGMDKSDESFLLAVVNYVNKKNQEMEEKDNDKIRK